MREILLIVFTDLKFLNPWCRDLEQCKLNTVINIICMVLMRKYRR